MSPPNLTFADRALWVPHRETLVIADLHLGRVRQSRVEFPVGETDDLLERLLAQLGQYEPDRVIVAGDLVHAFDSIPRAVADSVRELERTVTDAGAELVVTLGNHDTILEQVNAIQTVSTATVSEDLVVHHGHELPDMSGSTFIIGHQHPAITIEGDRRPCFLDCRNQFENSRIVVVPAFSRVAIGTNVNNLTAADTMSPLLTDMDQCRPIVSTETDVLRFPPLGEFRSYL